MDEGHLKKEIVFWANKLYERHLLVGASGNISARVDKDNILISKHNAYLGFMSEEDIILVNNEGKIKEGHGEASSELKLHLGILNKSDAQFVLHAHPPFTTAFFCKHDKLESFSFETKLYLSDIPVVPQETPTVVDIDPVVAALKRSNVVVLKNHGVASIGNDFKEAFSLIEILEELAKVNIALSGVKNSSSSEVSASTSSTSQKKYEMFSPDHIKAIVDLVNQNQEIQDKAKELDLTCHLAVKCDETGATFNFNFQKGYIADISNNEDAEFIISGSKDYWRMIFNRELDPFAATTQKKLKLKGDFAKLSRWYVPFVKIFDVWRQVPVE